MSKIGIVIRSRGIVDGASQISKKGSKKGSFLSPNQKKTLEILQMPKPNTRKMVSDVSDVSLGSSLMCQL